MITAPVTSGTKQTSNAVTGKVKHRFKWVVKRLYVQVEVDAVIYFSLSEQVVLDRAVQLVNQILI